MGEYDDSAPDHWALGKRSRRKISRKNRACNIGTGDNAMILAGEPYFQSVATVDGVFTISNACVKCRCGNHPMRDLYGDAP